MRTLTIGLLLLVTGEQAMAQQPIDYSAAFTATPNPALNGYNAGLQAGYAERQMQLQQQQQQIQLQQQQIQLQKLQLQLQQQQQMQRSQANRF